MIESRCGIKCNSCEYKDQMGCAGCIHIKKALLGRSMSNQGLCGTKAANALRRV